MKKIYEAPAMEVYCFETEDIVTTSGGLINGGAGSGNDYDWGDLFP